MKKNLLFTAFVFTICMGEKTFCSLQAQLGRKNVSNSLLLKMHHSADDLEKQTQQVYYSLEEIGEAAKKKSVQTVLEDGLMLNEAVKTYKNANLARLLLNYGAPTSVTIDSQSLEERVRSFDPTLIKSQKIKDLAAFLVHVNRGINGGGKIETIIADLLVFQQNYNGSNEDNPITDQDVLKVLQEIYLEKNNELKAFKQIMKTFKTNDNQEQPLDAQLNARVIGTDDPEDDITTEGNIDTIARTIGLTNEHATHERERSFDIRSFAIGGIVVGTAALIVAKALSTHSN